MDTLEARHALRFQAIAQVERPRFTMAENSGEHLDTQPWLLAVTKALSFAEDRGARVVGVTGDRPGVGVSLLSRELARAYVQHGMRAILIDASRLDMTTVGRSGVQSVSFDLRALASSMDGEIHIIDLATHGHLLPSNRQALRQLLETAAVDDVAIIVDLPSVHSETPHAAQVLSLVGAACQLAYLVCLSGVITKSELSACIESCKINRVPIQGIIVNDWKEPMARFATGW